MIFLVLVGLKNPFELMLKKYLYDSFIIKIDYHSSTTIYESNYHKKHMVESRNDNGMSFFKYLPFSALNGMSLNFN